MSLESWNTMSGQDRIIRRSEALSRTGAFLVWISLVILILSLIISFSFVIHQGSNGLTIDDFHRPSQSNNTWVAQLDVRSISSISGTIQTHEEEVKVSFKVKDQDGKVLREYEKKTPITFNLQLTSGGTYYFELNISEDDTDIDDFLITITMMGYDTLGVCFGAGCLISIFLGIGSTGLVFFILAIVKRKEERKRSYRPVYTGNRTYTQAYQYSFSTPDDQIIPSREREDDWGRSDYWEKKGVGRW